MQTLQMTLDAARGLFVGGSLSLLGVILVRLVASGRWFDHGLLVGPLIGAFVGAVWGLVRPVRWLDVASSVDRRHRLQDATATAWQLAELQRTEPIVQLQIQRATERLEQLAFTDRFHWQLPPAAKWGCALWLMAVAISLAPKATQPALARQDAADRPDPGKHAAIAEVLEKSIVDDLNRISKQAQLPQPEVRRLKSLQRELQMSVERIREPQQSTRAVLRELSKMQAKMAESQAAIRSQNKDQALSQIAQTLESAEELQAVADSLNQKEYQDAANQLSQMDPRPESPEVREQLQQALKEVAEDERQSGDTKVADAVESLSEAMEQTDAAQAQQLAQPLGQVLQDEALRLAVQQQLMVQLAALSEAKAMAQDGGKNTAKSDTSRETWGQGDAGDPLTGESRLPNATERKREQLTGVAGEGPSDQRRVQREVEESEATQVLPSAASRRFEQSAEEALRMEALPLSHRQTIRDYFRAINK